MSSGKFVFRGNDTIDPYPLIPGEAKKILIVKKDIFEELRRRYEIFCRGLAKRTAKRALNVKPRQKRPPQGYGSDVIREHFKAYEPSNAIAVNECDYRRWCRVNEWFAEFGPDAEKFERTILVQ
ncbi:MAG: hypothetical protein HY210_07965 [Candidatus Omnitrophica bacterium]|nr:hypothetical protein [Candidatus Omnitrophota bacterium]